MLATQSLKKQSTLPMLAFALCVAACGEEQDNFDVGSQEAALELALDGGCFPIVWQGASGQRRLDAHTGGNRNVVTREQQNNSTQLWCFTSLIAGGYTIQHQNFQGPFVDTQMDASGNPFVVLRERVLAGSQQHPNQRWTVVGTRITQVGSGLYLDAYPSAQNDYRAVLRTLQTDGTQDWSILAPPVPDPPPSCAPTASWCPPLMPGPVGPTGG